MALIKVITPSVTDANITTAKVTDNAITLAKMASGTDGNIISYDASGNPVAIATGSDGQVLTSTGAGSPPAFEALPSSGKVLQVVSATKSDTWSSSGTGNFQAVTGLSVAITPSATSSKVLILSATQLYTNDYGGGISLYKNSSQLVNPSSPSSRSIVNSGMFIGATESMSNLVLNHLDSPSSTSAQTYQIYAYVRSGTYYVNRSSGDEDNNDRSRTISTITAIEIAG